MGLINLLQAFTFYTSLTSIFITVLRHSPNLHLLNMLSPVLV